MHTRPELHDWKVVAVNDNCISITIDEDLSIEGTKLRVLGENRNFLFEVVPNKIQVKLDSYSFYFNHRSKRIVITP
jgi:hypothetical protein